MKAIHKHLFEQKLDPDAVCRTWPTLTGIPVERLERKLSENSDFCAALRSLDTGDTCLCHAIRGSLERIY